MNRDRLRAFLEENSAGRQLVVVSNRGPNVRGKPGSNIEVEIPAGGLSSAMHDVLKTTGGVWVASGSRSREKEIVDDRNCVPVLPGAPSYILKRLWLDPTTTDNYYHGYANRVLWPLCHITLDRVYFRRKFWKGYVEANRIFSIAVSEEVTSDSVVWVHDYHLCLLPGFLREEKPGLTMAHFWHIPWPDWSVFRVCPQAKELLKGLLGNDLIGFQIPIFVKNFMDCVREGLDADLDYRNAVVTYKGHNTKLKAYPISIDYEKFNAMAASRRTEKAVEKLKKRYRPQEGYVGIGVDRLEYTKALIKRIQAIDLFFERYKRFLKRFTFIQIAVPTRLKEPYLSYRKTVEELVARINEKYGKPDWKPLIYIDRKVDHQDLTAYYRMAHVAVISSVYDGMNLVAKEYVASQVETRGVLILSELAGAAEELDGALLVNPYDVEGFSDAIYKALTMPTAEKESRMAVLRHQVKEKDIYWWIADILYEVFGIAWLKSGRGRYLLNNLEELSMKNIFLFLDYDGTLAPIVDLPDEAYISNDMRELLLSLSRFVPIAVISGRMLADVMERVGIRDLVYAGNHGAEIWTGRREEVSRNVAGERKLLERLLVALCEDLANIPGAIVEDKGITASIHFRMVSLRDQGRFFDCFWNAVKRYEDTFRVTSGKKVLEIRPLRAWNKGRAVLWIWEKLGKGKTPIYIGDDTTDEDAFRAVKGRGISICVGSNPGADYYLRNQKEVRTFLAWINKHNSAWDKCRQPVSG